MNRRIVVKNQAVARLKRAKEDKMKATLRLKNGKGFHVVLQPESPEESAECCRLARHFDSHPQGVNVPLKLAYVTVEHTGDDVKEMAVGISF